MAERILSPNKFTYRAATAAFAAAASPTDIFEIRGAANIKVEVISVQLYGTQTTAGTTPVSLIKRSVANTGGTAVATTKVAKNAVTRASTATVQHYTANPTISGTNTAGTIESGLAMVPATTSIIAQPVRFFDLFAMYGTGVVLNGPAESLCINLGGTTVTGNSFYAVVEWTEELTIPVG